MRTIQFAVFLISMECLCAVGRASTIAAFDLDARSDFNLHELVLNAGHYTVSLRSGAFTGWSNFETTSDGCTDDCAQGWLNFFSVNNVQSGEGLFVENGVGTPFAEYDFNARLAYSTPEAALAAALPFHFMLDNAATVQVSIPDCEGCHNDNRGGLSFTVALVPEPTTPCLIALGIAGPFFSRGAGKVRKASLGQVGWRRAQNV